MQCGQGPDEVPFDVSQELVKGASLLVELAVLAAVTRVREVACASEVEGVDKLARFVTPGRAQSWRITGENLSRFS